MYLQRFGLRTLPFRLSPDTAFLYPSSSHAHAMEALRHLLNSDGGVTVMAGPAGVGKTTLIDRLLLDVPVSTAVARLNQGLPSAIALLQGLLIQFGYTPFHLTRSELGSALNTFLIERDRAGEKTLVVVDEAQRLDTEALLELLRAATPKSPRLDVLLVGDPTLPERLESPEMAPIHAAVMHRIALSPLRPDEVAQYVQHRLDTAGAAGRRIFEDAAIDMLTRVTGGLPKYINKLADGAMTSAYEDVRDAVRSDDILAASRLLGTIEHSQRRTPTPPPPPPLAPSVSAAPAEPDTPSAEPIAPAPEAATTATEPSAAVDDTPAFAPDAPASTDDTAAHESAPPEAPVEVAVATPLEDPFDRPLETSAEAQTAVATQSAESAADPSPEDPSEMSLDWSVSMQAQMAAEIPAVTLPAEEAVFVPQARVAAADAPPEPVYRLRLRHHGQLIETVQLMPGEFTIGRTRENDLQIESRYVSRRHCRLTLAAGQLTIEDLDSTNGVRVAGEPVWVHVLKSGDVVQLGVHELHLDIFTPED